MSKSVMTASLTAASERSLSGISIGLGLDFVQVCGEALGLPGIKKAHYTLEGEHVVVVHSGTRLRAPGFCKGGCRIACKLYVLNSP